MMDKKDEPVSLDLLIDTYININKNEQGIESQEMERIFDAAKQEIRQRIKQEVLCELTEEENREMKQKMENKSRKQPIKGVRNLLFGGGFLAVLIGLLVNQLTNWLDACTGKNMSWVIALCVVLGFLVCIFFVFFVFCQVIPLLDGDADGPKE